MSGAKLSFTIYNMAKTTWNTLQLRKQLRSKRRGGDSGWNRGGIIADYSEKRQSSPKWCNTLMDMRKRSEFRFCLSQCTRSVDEEYCVRISDDFERLLHVRLQTTIRWVRNHPN
ncbi:hypothetical protein RB195_012099 [Necator americanus]|uniref:Uncharacterized protein n=1 Tax=Necator americanus TaxID=51031 RepID=A0ABR1D747_NECAM